MEDNKMTIQEKIEKLEQELAQLKEELEKENRLWVPKDGQTFYYVWADGDVTTSISQEDKRKDFYNFFPTKRQAVIASGYMQKSNMIIKAYLQVDLDFEPDWGNGEQKKFYVYFNPTLSMWYPSLNSTVCFAPCYISTREKAQQVCDLLNREEV
jgi:hypothetical protein